MKKELKAILIIGSILVASAISLAIVLPLFKPDSTTSLGVVRIYVNSTIYDSIYPELVRYQQDVTNQGYSAQLISWSSTDESILKSNLINASLNGLVGVVLIGTLPIATFDYLGSHFACDFYFTDLDGDWLDVNPPPPTNDGILDYHGDGAGDMFPEIWIGRINPEFLTLPNYTNAYKDYFDRNHAYRTRALTRPHKALLYIDDSWSSWWNEYLSNFTAYADIDCYYNNSMTTPTQFKANLTQNYEYVQLLVHSDPHDHYWGVGNPPSEGYLNYNEIQALNTQPLFYNLYACSACDLFTKNNLGTHYLFSNNSLVVVGSTKTGGMNMYQSFYDELSAGKTFGNALYTWFHDSTYGPYGNSYSHSLSMGMVILGDPLLTIQM
ncbi:MAG: C25 family cysteine peptidase [Promethearchaeota archaeon]